MFPWASAGGDRGEAEVNMTNGVKRGAVESSTVFAWIVDLALTEAEKPRSITLHPVGYLTSR